MEKREEAISVSIRMRPVKSSKQGIVWKRVPGMDAVTQVSNDGKQTPIPNSTFQFGELVVWLII